jgi:hypothetical protein
MEISVFLVAPEAIIALAIAGKYRMHRRDLPPSNCVALGIHVPGKRAQRDRFARLRDAEGQEDYFME